MDRSRLGRVAERGERPLIHGRYRVHPAARRDIETIAKRLVVEQSPGKAESFVEAVRDAFLTIGERPHLGSLVQSKNPRLRALRKRSVAGGFLVFYLAAEKPVAVLRVLHSRQDWHGLLFVG